FPQPGGHPHYDQTSLKAAYRDGSDMRYVGGSGDRQRVYSTRVQQGESMALIQVERSVEPEHEALGKLLAGLLIGGAGGIVLAAIGASFEPLAAERGLELSTATADDVAVRGDREQLQQVILILLDNAVRYTAEGGRVHVQARRDGSNAIVTVHDTGIGIGEEELERVFERFYRADEARNRQSGGAGLGLAIARELVMRHGGRISVESTEGAGSTFTIQLPAA